MFNVKDVPVATGYTLMTLALVAMVAPTHGPPSLRVVGLVAGITLMVGHPPGDVVRRRSLAGGHRAAARWSSAARAPTCARPWPRRRPGSLVGGQRSWWPIYPNVFAHPAAPVRSASSPRASATNDGAGLPLRPVPPRRRSSRCCSRGSSPSAWCTAIRFAHAALADRPVPGRPGSLLVAGAGGGAAAASPSRRTPTSTTASVSSCSPRRRGRCWSPSGWRSGWPGRARTDASGWSVALALVALVAPDGRPGHAVPLPVHLLQPRPRRDRRARHVRLLAHQRARAAAGHPDRRSDRLRPDPVDPDSEHRRAATAPTGSRGVDAAGRYSSDSSVDCRTDPLGSAVPGLDRAGPAARRRAAARRVLRRDRPRPRGAPQLHPAGIGDPAPTLARGLDDLRGALPARPRSLGDARGVRPAAGREHGARRCGPTRPRAG